MWDCVKSPVNKGLGIVGSGARIEGAISGYDTDVAIVDLVESSSFDDSDAEGRISGETGGNGQATCARPDDDIIKGSITRYTKRATDGVGG